MRYLGGKSRFAKDIAAVCKKYRGGLPFWDPFCGSLAVAIALGGSGYCSDISQPLISLYNAVAGGWVPPNSLDKDQWNAAKSLPDTNPLKGFAGFGCSYRGMFFQGYGGGDIGHKKQGAEEAYSALMRDIPKLATRGVTFAVRDFLQEEPRPGLFLYLDPPYRDTAGYKGVPQFDYDAFYSRVLGWAKYGPVIVSEYDLPIGEVVWEKSACVNLVSSSGKRATERLFLVVG